MGKELIKIIEKVRDDVEAEIEEIWARSKQIESLCKVQDAAQILVEYLRRGISVDAEKPEKLPDLAPDAQSSLGEDKASVNRKPPGTPTLFEMIRTVLIDAEDGDCLMTREQIRREIERRWWPGLTMLRLAPDMRHYEVEGKIERTTVEGMVLCIGLTDKGRGYQRDATPSPSPETVAPTPLAETSPVDLDEEAPDTVAEAPSKPTREVSAKAQTFSAFRRSTAPAPQPNSPIGQQVRGGATVDRGVPGEDLIDFEHNGKVAKLSKREWRMVKKLIALPPGSFLPYDRLMNEAFGSTDRRPGMDPSLWLSGTVPVLQGKIDPLGLQIHHVKRQGYRLFGKAAQR